MPVDRIKSPGFQRNHEEAQRSTRSKLMGAADHPAMQGGESAGVYETGGQEAASANRRYTGRVTDALEVPQGFRSKRMAP